MFHKGILLAQDEYGKSNDYFLFSAWQNNKGEIVKNFCYKIFKGKRDENSSPLKIKVGSINDIIELAVQMLDMAGYKVTEDEDGNITASFRKGNSGSRGESRPEQAPAQRSVSRPVSRPTQKEIYHPDKIPNPDNPVYNPEDDDIPF
jgi:hypothetical protein